MEDEEQRRFAASPSGDHDKLSRGTFAVKLIIGRYLRREELVLQAAYLPPVPHRLLNLLDGRELFQNTFPDVLKVFAPPSRWPLIARALNETVDEKPMHKISDSKCSPSALILNPPISCRVAPPMSRPANETYLSIRQVFPDHLDYPAGTSFVSRFKTGFFGIISSQQLT
jgi:hypothetical protein